MSTSWLVTNLVAAVVLPPLNGLLPAFAGLVVLRRKPRLGKGLIIFGLSLLAMLSVPVIASGLIGMLERQYDALPRSSLGHLQADAIVILGSGRYRNAPEFGDDDVKGLALERLRYGALVARESGGPILVTGGNPYGGGRTEAEVMKIVLARDFGVEVRWAEARSENTNENALFSAQILIPQGVRRIALVTHAFHMPRSVAAFEAAGFEVLPAPTAFLHIQTPITLYDFVPRYEAMQRSGWALHEMIGLIWYRLKG